MVTGQANSGSRTTMTPTQSVTLGAAAPMARRAGVAVPVALALVAAVFSTTWPVAQAVSGGVWSLSVIAFACALAVGFAFVGALAGSVLDAASRATVGVALRLPRVAVLALLVAALALGVWFGSASAVG